MKVRCLTQLIFLWILVLVGLPILAQAEVTDTAQRIGQSWAGDVELGRTIQQAPLQNDALWNIRARGGFLAYQEPYFFSTGVGVDWTSHYNFLTTSAYAEILHLWSGLWLNTAIGADQMIRPVITASTGWSLFGIRFKYHFDEPTDYYQVFATLKIPIGILFLKLNEKL